jgi:hypothetical protein
MTPNRRDLIKSSIAITFITVSKTASAQQPKKVGIVSTIRLQKTDEEWLCLVKGLNYGGYQLTGGGPLKHVDLHDPQGVDAKYGGSHGTNDLKTAFNGFNNVDVIGAVGGVISRVAASQVLTSIPYVYLSGMAPSDPSTTPSTPLPTSVAGKYCGIILNTPALYPNARTALSSNAANVWLVQNYNSGMTKDELAAWQNGFRNDRDFRFFQPASASNPIDNVAANFPTEVAKLKATMGTNVTGVIISPDAFFRWQHPLFTSAITDPTSGLGVPICYPFKDYSLGTNDQLLNGGAVLSIPITSTTTDPEVQATAYCQFGMLVALMLDNPSVLIASKKWAGAWV